MKHFFSVLFATIFCIIIIAGLTVGGFFLLYTPTLTADFGSITGELTNGASGYLYGLAEDGVPSHNMTESIDISTVSQKVPDGLQHPIGDISHISSQLENTDYNVVYLQDAYGTWYYEHRAIEEMRSKGEYDWKAFVTEDFLPRVKKTVETLSATDYSDKVVYCLYNECDNGVWFGQTKENDSEFGVYGEYNEIGAQTFFEAWKLTYDYVKAINKDALIGGPGFYEYNNDKLRAFLSYCVDNDCVPDVMIYHELGDYSIRLWRKNVRDYKALEQELGIDELPIIVTEYGRMQDNGLPGKMLQYVTQIELSGVYGDNAFWRLADNLCDVAADDNSPNSNWWLYRWYADMDGSAPEIKYQDLFNSNFENAFIKRKEEYTSWGYMGLASINKAQDRIDIICGGRSGSAAVKLKNLDETQLMGKVCRVKIEEAVYKGLSGVVNKPRVISEHLVRANSKLRIDLNDMDEANAYHIVVTLADEDNDIEYDTHSYLKRFEFESGELLGDAYTYDSAYATTGELQGMVGGMENDGDGVFLTFDVPKDDTYTLDVIFGNANDGAWGDNGRQSPDDRADAKTTVDIDGKAFGVFSLPNTIKSEYTDCYSFDVELSKGKHTIEFCHNEGTYVLDSLVVSTVDANTDIAVIEDGDRTTDTSKAFLVVAPYAAYYKLTASDDCAFTVNSKSVIGNGDGEIYLMRGLNYLEFATSENISIQLDATDDAGKSTAASDMKLTDGAHIEKDGSIVGISSKGGKASCNVSVDRAGTYALTILYANNDENGVHDYNVDLLEDYVTITSNGRSQDVFCRNTYSWQTFKTVTAYVELKSGSNTIEFTNSGNVIFNDNEAFAPHIKSISVNELSK